MFSGNLALQKFIALIGLDKIEHIIYENWVHFDFSFMKKEDKSRYEYVDYQYEMSFLYKDHLDDRVCHMKIFYNEKTKKWWMNVFSATHEEVEYESFYELAEYYNSISRDIVMDDDAGSVNL